jgi:putative ABC transport system permease protein
VSYSVWFGGVYIDERNFFAQFAVDPKNYLDIYPEYSIIPPDGRQAFQRERTACIVGEKLAKKYGFKVGDQLTLKGTIFPGTWDFTIRGIARSDSPDADSNFMLFSWEYLNQRMGQLNQVGIYLLEINDPAHAGDIARAVDATFANSPAETKTETEKAFQLGFITMLGNIQMVILSVGTAIVIAIMLVSMNTMMMAARERTREVAVLKALGFTDRAVLNLVLSESLMISLLGGLLGAGLARLTFGLTDFTAGGFFPRFYVTDGTILRALGIALTLGLISGAIPAWNASRLRVVDALRHSG